MPSEIDMYRKVLPLVGLNDPEHPTESEVLGTAFVVTDGVLVTCWHVIRNAIEKDWTVIAAWDRRGDGRFTRLDVTDIERRRGHLPCLRLRVRRPWRHAMHPERAGHPHAELTLEKLFGSA